MHLRYGMKAAISVVVMTTVCPLTILTAMSVVTNPAWSQDLKLIGFMWIFGVLLPNPFWLTAIPSTILLPLLLKRVSQRTAFQQLSGGMLVMLSMLAGSLVGGLLVLPAVFVGTIGQNSLEKWLYFLPFGVLGGVITLPMVTFLYRIPTAPTAQTPSGGAMRPSDGTPPAKWDTSAMHKAAWFRAILALVGFAGAAWQLVVGFASISHGCMDRFGGEIAVYLFGLPLLVIGGVSTGIAIALFRKSVPGIWAALVFDAIIVLAVLGVVTMCLSEFYDTVSPLSDRVTYGLISTAVALPFGIEAAWLLSACRGWRRAWWGLGCVVLVLVLPTVVGPLVAHCLPAR